MNKIFEKLGNLFEKRPFKSLFITLIVFVLMIVGAVNIGMSTGSETLVQTDNDAYISNFEMENEFGSDAIMILFEGDEDELLSLDNLLKLYNIEQKLEYTEGIFTIMSPASVVHQITDKQISEIKKQVPNMSKGLAELGSKLEEIAKELGGKDLPDPSILDDKINSLTANMNPDSLLEDFEGTQAELEDKFKTMSSGLSEMGSQLSNIGKELGSKDVPNPKDFEDKFDELSNITVVFDDLINGQNMLEEGVTQMGDGLNVTTFGIGVVSQQLKDLANQSTNPQEKQQLMQLSGMLDKSIEGLSTMAENTGNLTQVTTNTTNGLNMIGKNLNTQLNEMKKALTTGGLDPDELKTMAEGFVMMGGKLDELSKGISSMDMDDMLPDTSSIFDDLTKDFENEMSGLKSMFDDGLDPAELTTMSEGFELMGENLVTLSEGLEIFAEKSEMVIPHFPHNKSELDNILYDDGSLRAVFEETVIDENHIMMMIKLDGNIDDSIIDAIYAEIQDVVDSEDVSVDYIISGKPVLDSSLRTEMKSNMIVMVVSAVALMFMILSFVFKVRWKVLSLGIVFVSVIATLGLMGHLSVSMTMVSMAVFPILIGLGVDYSIQIQNRYEEEKSVTITLTQIGSAVGKAVVATVLGFISLYASPVPMIQDFGKMLTIGVVVSFIGSVFLLLPILKARDLVDEKESKSQQDAQGGLMDKLLSGIGYVSTKFSWIIVIISIILSVMGLVADQKVGVETDIETFMPQDMAALHDIHKVRDIVGSTNQMNLYFEDDNILSEDNIAWTKDIIKEIENTYADQIVDIKSLNNLVDNMVDDKVITHQEYLDIIDDIPQNQQKMFINEDHNKSVILMNVEHMATEELQEFVESMYETIESSPMKVSVTGKSVLDVEMVSGLTDGRLKMTIIGLVLVFMALLIMYRSFFKAFVVVFPVVIIVGMSGGIMYLMGLNYTPITATLGALILGMGTETNIMLQERYLEERNNGKNKRDAIDTTLTKIGAATMASGFTTLGGFSVLMTSKFVILKDFGLMTVINISLELVSTFILVPASLWLLDRFIVKKVNS